MPKRSFDIRLALTRIGKAVEPFAKAAMFQLHDEGFTATFEQLVACMISIRTFDEVTIPTAKRLFERARTPEEVARLTPAAIDNLIHACTFHERKAQQIHAIARQTVEQYDGKLPCDAEVLQSFGGVGPKCAHLVMGVACGEPFISVDIHVHRVTNRWGYVKTKSPEDTMRTLEEVLPERYWIEINRLLVPFGKHICTGRLPHCSACPVLDMCQQVGVTTHR
jgi:endonuclease III